MPTTAAPSTHDQVLWQRYNALLAVVPAMLDERVRATTGLNHFQFGVLEMLHRQPERRLQLADVARASESSLSRLSHTVTRLEALGLVERQACDEDRRASWAVLTPAGAEMVDNASGVYETLMRDTLLDRIPVDQRENALALLTALLPREVAEECTEIDGR